MADLYKPLARGVWGILATPFCGQSLAIDTDSLARLVAHYRLVGATGVVALGVLGEAARLNTAERRLVLETVVKAAGTLPVVAGMATTGTAPAVEEAAAAAAAGARAVMVPVPTNDPALVARHLQTIAEASGLGIVLQDHPAATGVVIAPRVLAQATRDAGVVIAIKAEAPPTAPTIAIVAQNTGVPIFGGLGGVSLLDELLAGSAGAMTGFAVPEALIATVTAWHREGFGAAREQFVPWLPLILFEAQDKISLAIRKEILCRRGLIAEARVRAPGLPMPTSLEATLAAHLAAIPFPDLPMPA
jgi:4-hydroxy-tetrahydrodipicolinate synthase